METHVAFRSDLFPPLEGEEDGVNPGRYGKRLAEFISKGLSMQGFETGVPLAEDWGWVVPIKNESFRLCVGCGNYDEYSDGFLCFIEPHAPIIRKFFKKIDVSERIKALRDAMDELLSAEPAIREKRWWTYEAFNSPQC